MKIGIIKEGKTPPDSRVVFAPEHCEKLAKEFPQISLQVASSNVRSFKDDEYKDHIGDIIDQDVLVGVKEVPIDQLIENKTYFFFSHTIKAQAYNRDLLRAILKKNITLIDYECLVDNKGKRVIAFGRWAGIVGAHNGLVVWGKKFNKFDWGRCGDFKDYEELQAFYKTQKLPAIKIAITGGGRVALGAIEIMDHLDVRRVSHADFVNKQFDEAVYVQLDCEDLYRRKSDNGFGIPEFYQKPELYKSIFEPYKSVVDVFINAIYWDPKAPKYFELNEIEEPNFKMDVIADITCDIAPDASVPVTYRATEVPELAMGIDRNSKEEVAPFQQGTIDVMSIDHLPSELPRDASTDFGNMFVEHVIPELLKPQSDFLDRATITKDGKLTEKYAYLQNYVDGIDN